MTRPRIDTNARRSRQVGIRLTPAEARVIATAAARTGRPPVRDADLAAAVTAVRDVVARRLA